MQYSVNSSGRQNTEYCMGCHRGNGEGGAVEGIRLSEMGAENSPWTTARMEEGPSSREARRRTRRAGTGRGSEEHREGRTPRMREGKGCDARATSRDRSATRATIGPRRRVSLSEAEIAVAMEVVKSARSSSEDSSPVKCYKSSSSLRRATSSFVCPSGRWLFKLLVVAAGQSSTGVPTLEVTAASERSERTDSLKHGRTGCITSHHTVAPHHSLGCELRFEESRLTAVLRDSYDGMACSRAGLAQLGREDQDAERAWRFPPWKGPDLFRAPVLYLVTVFSSPYAVSMHVQHLVLGFRLWPNRGPASLARERSGFNCCCCPSIWSSILPSVKLLLLLLLLSLNGHRSSIARC